MDIIRRTPKRTDFYATSAHFNYVRRVPPFCFMGKERERAGLQEKLSFFE